MLTVRTRSLAIGLIAAVGSFSALGAGTAVAGVPLSAGQLTGADGRPASGTVRLYNIPRDLSVQPQLVGEGAADAAGNYRVVSLDDARLSQLAAANGGRVIDLMAAGYTAGATGTWTFSMLIERAGNAVTATAVGESASRATLRSADGAAPGAARVDVRARQSLARPGIQFRQAQQCVPGVETRKPESRRSSAVVGDLNNAYNDGTRAAFDYARTGKSSTKIGVAQSFDSGASFSISGENYIEDEAEVNFPQVARRYARKLRTQFEFTKYQARTSNCSPWSVEIRATSFIGGTNDSIKQAGALDKCQTDQLVGYKPTAGFKSRQAQGTRFTRGVESFGVNLTTQTDLNEKVTVAHRFGGSKGKEHFLCAPDGKSSPFTSGRVFSGARR